jgi:ferredoxin-NADP reductase
MPGIYQTKLLEKVPRAGDIVSFRFKRPDAYRFEPGQWFVVTFASDDPREPWEHHLSHSDSPTEPWLEFTTRLRGTPFKNALGALPVGAPVQIEGPFGAFVMPPGVERAVFLAGGIGITCVRSILRWLCDTCGIRAVQTGDTPVPPQEVFLFYANHSEDVIPFKEDLDEIARDLPGLRIVHVISDPGEAWTGHSGHIDQEILSRELGGPGDRKYFVSGPPSFVTAMRETLAGFGVADEAIAAERFLGY